MTTEITPAAVNEQTALMAEAMLDSAKARYEAAVEEAAKSLAESGAGYTLTWKAQELVERQVRAEVARFIYGEDGEGDGKPVAERIARWMEGQRQAIEMGLAIRGSSRSTNGYDRMVEQDRQAEMVRIYGKLAEAERRL